MPDAILESEEHVLTTLEKDGSRTWLKPKLAKGFFLSCRRAVAYFLIGIFTLLPLIYINGKQALFLDIAKREFTFFGFTFFPTDTLLLAIFGVGVLVSIFLFTSLIGRVWCGWACPQTVYMEFVFRPIERLIEGTVGRGGKPKGEISSGRLLLKYLIYLAVCFYLANTFLAYFVGSQTLLKWVQMSPFQNPVPFLIVSVVTFFMMYNFCFFREQLCILACPYGRFQSVLLDEQSMVICYDRNRGEPRGRLHKQLKKQGDKQDDMQGKGRENVSSTENPGLKVLSQDVPQKSGDCIDCKKCVTVCPTGIDIRDGLQMECINCTQCIDVCNEVMKKVGRDPGLIRFGSEAEMRTGERNRFRARVILYPLILLCVIVAFVSVLVSKQGFTATVLRGTGNQFSIEHDNQIRNQLRIRIVNRGDEPKKFRVESLDPEVALTCDFDEISIEPGEMQLLNFSAVADYQNFSNGKLDFEIRVVDTGTSQESTQRFRLIGPLSLPKEAKK